MATLLELWELLGDLAVSPKRFSAHFGMRAVCLLLIPLTVYTAFFQVHFLVLNKKADGSSFMSIPFRATLQGEQIPDAFVGLFSLCQLI